MGDYPPPAPPVERVVDEVEAAVEAADPDVRRSGGSSSAKAAAKAKAERERLEREKAAAAKAAADALKNEKLKTGRREGPISSRDKEFVRQLSDEYLRKEGERIGDDIEAKGGNRSGTMGVHHPTYKSSLKKANKERAKALIKKYGANRVSRLGSIADQMSSGFRPTTRGVRREAILGTLIGVLEASPQPQEGEPFSLSLPVYLEKNPQQALSVRRQSFGAGFVQEPLVQAAESEASADEFDEILSQLEKNRKEREDAGKMRRDEIASEDKALQALTSEL